jgi:hypothetical protein
MNFEIFVLIVIIMILSIKILMITFNYEVIENFDESKINTKEVAESRLVEFNYDKYAPYIKKYYSPMKIINLSTIPVQSNGKIFCSVASYRDKQCPLTIFNMVNMAKNPENLVICICQQNDDTNDPDCINDYVNDKNVVIKIMKLTDKEARGPCWARFLIQQEWRGEEYFLQIDSHMRFVQNWDEKCINDIKQLPPKSCLTNYVSNFNLETGEPDTTNQLRGPLKIVNKETTDDGFFRVNSDFITSTDKPLLAWGWSACFSFSKGNILHDAPYDAYTQFLFFGEEMDVWARMYTRGWMVYAPSVPICFTSFDRSYRPTFWENPDQENGEYLARLRLYYKFGYLNEIPKELLIELEQYSLGTTRTWQQFLEFCLDEKDE